jgi:hypothetical protein
MTTPDTTSGTECNITTTIPIGGVYQGEGRPISAD